MYIIGTFIEVGILWFLITLFTGSTNSSQSLRETWIVIIGMMIVGFFSRLLLNWLIGPFIVVVQIVALYFLIDKVLEEPRKTSLKICGWYLGVSFLFSLCFALLFSS